jgi:hypothetical protein
LVVWWWREFWWGAALTKPFNQHYSVNVLGADLSILAIFLVLLVMGELAYFWAGVLLCGTLVKESRRAGAFTRAYSIAG